MEKEIHIGWTFCKMYK